MSFIRTIARDLDVLKAVHVGVRTAKKHVKLIEPFEQEHLNHHTLDPEWDCKPSITAFYEMLGTLDRSEFAHHPFGSIAYNLTIQSWRNQVADGVEFSVIPMGPDSFDGVDMNDEEAVKAIVMKALEGQQDFERVVSETGEPEPKTKGKFGKRGRK